MKNSPYFQKLDQGIGYYSRKDDPSYHNNNNRNAMGLLQEATKLDRNALQAKFWLGLVYLNTTSRVSEGEALLEAVRAAEVVTQDDIIAKALVAAKDKNREKYRHYTEMAQQHAPELAEKYLPESNRFIGIRTEHTRVSSVSGHNTTGLNNPRYSGRSATATQKINIA